MGRSLKRNSACKGTAQDKEANGKKKLVYCCLIFTSERTRSAVPSTAEVQRDVLTLPLALLVAMVRCTALQNTHHLGWCFPSSKDIVSPVITIACKQAHPLNTDGQQLPTQRTGEVQVASAYEQRANSKKYQSPPLPIPTLPPPPPPPTRVLIPPRKLLSSPVDTD